MSPNSPAAHSARDMADGLGGLLCGMSVLLAEDEACHQLVARNMLERLGASVSLATSGLEVQDQLRSRLFDVVLMDLHMPHMEGEQATRWIREQPMLKSLPVIAHTGSASDAARSRCLMAGMNGFIKKPGTMQNLADALVRWKAPSL